MQENKEPQPLVGLRVIDLTHGIAGPFCTKLLSDFGADVVKVERPEKGDYARTMGPFPQDVPHPEKSGIFLFLNTNKRGITLDLKTPAGVEALKRLAKDADVLVESYRPGVMDRLGLGYDVLKAINPNLIVTSVSNFGQTGPYKDYRASELTLFAMGNRMTASGLPERPPIKLGGNHVQYQAGNNAAMATLFAWYAREHQGMGGQQVDVSIMETQMASINMRLLGLVQYQYTGDRGLRLGAVRAGYPSGPYPCLDGYVSVSGGGQRFPRIAGTVDMPELANDPRYASPEGQADLDAREEFEGTIWLPWLLQHTVQEVVEKGQANELLIAPILTIDQVVDNNPQLEARKYFVEIDHPEAGKIKYPGAPIVTEGNWWRVHRPAPLQGQHNQEILGGELGYSEDEVKRLGQGDASLAPATTTALAPAPASTPSKGNGKGRLPLEGVRVIDMAVIYAGPYGTMFLGDVGAEVVRVETLQRLPATSRGQFARPSKESLARAAFAPYPDREPGERPWNRFGGFNQHARNKYGMTLDVTKPEGKDVMRKLVEASDVFIENNGLGSMDRLGIGWDTVSKWNPRLIMISISGFGMTGPWNYYVGIGSQFEASVGHASVSGYSDMDAEGVPPSVAADATCGVTVAAATIMALRQRELTGRGSLVDISLGEAFLPHLGELFMDYTMNGRVAGPPGNRDHQGHQVQGAYPCAGNDEWIAISVGQIEEWHALCRVMGQPQLIEDPRFEDMPALRSHHNEFDQILRSWTVDKDPVELFHRLQKEGVVAGHLLHEAHAYADPHLKAREFFVPITHPEAGTHLYPTTTFKLSKAPFEVRKPPMRMGEDNDYLYRDVLKLSEAEYDNLKALGHIGMDYAAHVR